MKKRRRRRSDNMSFDCDFRFKFTIRKEDKDKAKELLDKWTAEHDTEDTYMDFYPDIHEENDEVQFILCNEWDELLGTLHNDYLHSHLDEIIGYLNDNGIPVTGWLLTIYESGQDAWYDIWIDGKFGASFGYEDTAEALMMCIQKNLVKIVET